MCLDIVTKCEEDKDPGPVWAYKIFIENRNGYLSSFFFKCFVQRGEWIRAETCVVKASDGNSYPSGFHAFTSHEDAKAVADIHKTYGIVYIVLPVMLRSVHTRGVEYYGSLSEEAMNVVVAEEMFVPEGGFYGQQEGQDR